MVNSPRVLVSLSPERRAELERIAEATDKSMAAVLRELFDASAPVLLRVAEACERAKLAKAETREGIAAAFRAAEAAVAPMRSFALGELEAAMRGLPEPSGEGAAGRASMLRSARPAAPDPRPVITGVKHCGSKRNQGVSKTPRKAGKRGA